MPFFGNALCAKVLTVGVNPSATELAPNRWPPALADTEVVRRLLTYFDGQINQPPPHQWFHVWRDCLALCGLTYGSDAAHIDLSPRLTTAMRGQDRTAFCAMVEADLDLFWQTLDSLPHQPALLIAGTVASVHYIDDLLRDRGEARGYRWLRQGGAPPPGTRRYVGRLVAKGREWPLFYCSVSPSARPADRPRLFEGIERHAEVIRTWASNVQNHTCNGDRR